jgi:hypothetical protein
MRKILTACIWIVALASLVVGGLIATMFMLIATSLDPTDIVTAGVEPWTDALDAGLAFVALVVATALGLFLWHSARFKFAGLLTTLAVAACVAWTSVQVYHEYF